MRPGFESRLGKRSNFFFFKKFFFQEILFLKKEKLKFQVFLFSRFSFFKKFFFQKKKNLNFKFFFFQDFLFSKKEFLEFKIFFFQVFFFFRGRCIVGLLFVGHIKSIRLPNVRCVVPKFDSKILIG